MSTTCLLLFIGSLASLVLGLIAWQQAGGRALLFSTLFGTLALAVAASDALLKQQMFTAFIMAFTVATMFAIRGGIFFWKSQADPELGLPAMLLSGVALITTCGAINALIHL